MRTITKSLLALSLASGLAHAGPLVTQWSYVNNAVFTAATFNSGGGSTFFDADELSWGAAGGNFEAPTANPALNRSALTIGITGSTLTGGGPSVGLINTSIDALPNLPGEIGNGMQFTHHNNILSGNFATLTSGSISDTLALTPNVPVVGPGPVNGPTLTFNFEFRETPNSPASGFCADGSTVGSNPGGCPDLFAFLNTNVVDQLINYDGNQYFASVLVLDALGNPTIGIGNLTPGECQFIYGPGTTVCQGFRTTEVANTTVPFGIFIAAVPQGVPEPATLALLGLGLFGLGALRSTKKQA